MFDTLISQTTDTTNVDDCTWTFARSDHQIQIARTLVADGHILELTSDRVPHAYFFADLADLVVFQTDMEALLVKTGWAFVGFTPERRSKRDRRSWPRIDERRRWWTDGQHQESVHARNRRSPKPPRG